MQSSANPVNTKILGHLLAVQIRLVAASRVFKLQKSRIEDNTADVFVLTAIQAIWKERSTS